MALVLPKREEQAVEAAIAFANLRQPTAARVERLFAAFVDPRDYDLGRSFTVDLAATHEDVQAQVRDWLDRIVTSHGARKAVADEVASAVEASVSAHVLFVRGRIAVTYYFESVAAVCAFAAALMLDESKGLTSRLGKCGWCGRFNLDLHAKGRPRRFCSAEHKRLADNASSAVKVRKWRKENTRKS